MKIQDIPLTHIYPRNDARVVSEATVASLQQSIAEVGLLSPIHVREAKRLRSGVMSDAWELMAGRHRFEAVQRLGWETVPAIVETFDDVDAELVMIDENLCRAELSPAERAVSIRRRQVLYLQKHPETAEHVAGAYASNRAQGNADENFSPAAPSFAADTAAKTGKSTRAIEIDASRGKDIVADVLVAVRGTRLDKGTYLDELKRLSPEEQREKIKADLAADKPAKKPRASSSSSGKQKGIDADVKSRAAIDVAEMIAEYVPDEALKDVQANLYKAGAKNIGDALSNLMGKAVMDRRYG